MPKGEEKKEKNISRNSKNDLTKGGSSTMSGSCDKRHDGITATTDITKKNRNHHHKEVQMQGSCDASGNKRKNNSNGVGLSEIDAMFAGKKEKDAVEKEREEKEEQIIQQQKKRRSEERSDKKIQLSYDRNDIGKVKSGEWAQDGLGGVFDSEGFTGRREGTQGLKVFKAHLFNKKGFGTSKDCPFDCDCCFI